MGCKGDNTIAPAVWEVLKKLPAFRYMRFAVGRVSELYEKYTDGLELGAFAYVYNENTIYIYDPLVKEWKAISAGVEYLKYIEKLLSDAITEINNALSNYYNKEEIDNALSNYYNKEEIGNELSGLLTKTQADTYYAAKDHTHAALTLQIGGATKATYNAGSAATFNITAADLNALIQSVENTNNITGGVLNYTMHVNRNTYKYLETASGFSMAESSSASVACNTEFDLFVKNTGSSAITVTLPDGANNISYKSAIDVEAGKAIEIIVLGYGIRRITTYLPFNN
jgi:hypothetical protein